MTIKDLDSAEISERRALVAQPEASSLESEPVQAEATESETVEAAATPEASARKVFVLLLDADDVYKGVRECLADEVTDGEIALDHAPDNTPDAYKWHRADRALMPLESFPPASTPFPASSLNAQAWIVWSLYTAGIKLERPVIDWFNQYAASVDFGPQSVGGAAPAILKINIKPE
jgi:hypothetical protein